MMRALIDREEQVQRRIKWSRGVLFYATVIMVITTRTLVSSIKLLIEEQFIGTRQRGTREYELRIVIGE